MSMKAVIAFLSTLREEQRKSPPQVSRAMRAIGGPDLDNVGSNYVWKVEKGEIPSPSIQRIAAWARALGASLDTVGDLLLRPDATEEEGLRRAFLQTVGPEEATRLARQARGVLEFQAEAEQRRPPKSKREGRRSSHNGQSHDTEEETEES